MNKNNNDFFGQLLSILKGDHILAHKIHIKACRGFYFYDNNYTCEHFKCENINDLIKLYDIYGNRVFEKIKSLGSKNINKTMECFDEYMSNNKIAEKEV